jgi:hypothetical protein
MSGPDKGSSALADRIHSRSGMTFVELILAMAVFTFVLGLACACLNTTNIVLEESRSQMQLSRSGRQFMCEFERSVRSATAVEVNDVGSTLVLAGADGEDISYCLDEESASLSRYIRDQSGDGRVRCDSAFPANCKVVSCSFDLTGNTVSAALILSADGEGLAGNTCSLSFFSRTTLGTCIR